jgi:hypothetical protein
LPKLPFIITKKTIEQHTPPPVNTNLNDNSEEDSEKSKVSIVLGLGLENIKQENGGGWRYLLLNKNDDYDAIFRKLIKLYFPGKHFFLNPLNFSFNVFIFSQFCI